MSERDSGTSKTVIIAVIVASTLALGIPILDGIVSAGGGDVTTKHGPVSVTTGEAAYIDQGGDVKSVLQVNDSTGYAVQFTGADDSYLESNGGLELGTVNNWTVATWAAVEQGAETENMTVVSAGGDVLLQYNGTRGNWTAYYYDRGSRETWRVDVDAANQPGNLTLVTATANETHFWIARNTTRGEIVNITGENSAAYGNYSNFNGTVDETRMFNDTTNASERSDLFNNPVAPRKDRDRTARLMYDEGSGTTTAIYSAGADATLSNTSWVRGHPGHVLVKGTDYSVSWDSERLTALAGGRIDGAPVAWVTYRFSPQPILSRVTGSLGSAFTLGALIVLVLFASRVLSTDLFGGSGGRRR